MAILIDGTNSMLNVAVSRAKDSFLVFGDMEDLFESQPASSPRGLLKKYLFAAKSNALQFESKQRQDLIAAKTQFSVLHGVEQHDAFLRQTLVNISQQITIVSPWINRQKMQQTGFLTSMAEARSRGVDITIVTDRLCNTENNDNQKSKQREQRFFIRH